MGDERRYRAAEQRLFDDAGIAPIEHWIELPKIGVRTRLLEVGDGEPTLFLPGGPNAAATWSYVAGATSGLRCLMLDRPGTGLSDPLPTPPDDQSLPAYVAQLTADTLDALGIERAHVVGSSFGGYSALRSAIAHPERVARVVLAGCPAFVPGWKEPGFFGLLRAPMLGRLMLAAPATRAAVRMSLRQFGEQRALADVRIPKAMLDWILAWHRHTDTFRNDATMILALGRHGFDPALDLTAAELGRIDAPCHLYFGTDDPIGGVEVARTLASLLPRGDVEMLPGAGHLPWLGDPDRFARSITSFLGAVSGPR